jgi:hypothetical protein
VQVREAALDDPALSRRGGFSKKRWGAALENAEIQYLSTSRLAA